jgi:hypothetical protein
VRSNLVSVVCACVGISISAIAWTHAQQQQQQQKDQQQQKTDGASSFQIDEVLRAIRGDLQNNRADIVAKNVELSGSQARQFWPLFERYQGEQNLIMDDQLKQVQWFIENFDQADDAAALKLINAHFERDIKMTALRQSWLGEFQKVLGTKLAVRVMQIDRRVSLTQQAYVASKIPLAY